MFITYLIYIVLFSSYILTNCREEQLTPFVSERIVYDNVTVRELINASSRYLLPTPNEDKIRGSMRRFINDAEHTLNRSSFRLLCVTIMESSKMAFKKLINMMFTLKGDCHWAILMTHGDMQLANHLNRTFHYLRLNRSRIVLFEYTTSRLDVLTKYGIFDPSIGKTPIEIRNAIARMPFNHKILPKPLILTSLIPIARKYEYVWVLDNDIDIAGYNTSQLLRNIHCSFRHKPLIAQPLIHESTQLYKYLNYNTWRNRNSNILAVEMRFIEKQTPIFRGIFLEWFLTYIGGLLLLPVHVLGVDYGIDQLYCKTAQMFANEMMISQNYLKYYPLGNEMKLNRVSNESVACALIVGGQPVHHWSDLHVDRAIDGVARRALYQHLEDMIHDLFPTFALSGFNETADPFYGNNSKELKASHELTKKCKFDTPQGGP
jgi:hypothetical protein